MGFEISIQSDQGRDDEKVRGLAPSDKVILIKFIIIDYKFIYHHNNEY